MLEEVQQPQQLRQVPLNQMKMSRLPLRLVLRLLLPSRLLGTLVVAEPNLDKLFCSFEVIAAPNEKLGIEVADSNIDADIVVMVMVKL